MCPNLMEMSLSERLPHADDVSPEDVWGDVAALWEDLPGTGTPLPPRRVKEENAAPNAGGGGVGLRIGEDLTIQAAGEALAGMEVQEINGRVVRLNPETAAEPWAPRQFKFHQKPEGSKAGRSHAGETRDWGKAKKQPLVWVFGCGAAVVAGVVWAVMLLPSIDKSLMARPRPGDTELVLEPDGMTADAVAIKQMLARQTEAESILHALVAAPAAADVLPMLRDAADVAALIQRDHHLIGTCVNQRPPLTDHWTALQKEGITYGLLKGTFPDFSNFEAYFVVEDGRLVLDWKASTAYGTADFGELAQKRGNAAEIRAWISNAGFYTLAYPEAEFQCHQLVSPDKQQSIWAYSRRGGLAESFFSSRLQGGYILPTETESMKVTLRLEPGPDDALPNQWLIGELLHKDWISP